MKTYAVVEYKQVLMIARTTLILRSLGLPLIVLATLLASACGSEAKEAQKPVEETLKKAGAQDVKVDLFLKAVDIPDKAYLSVTATWGFATREGTPQKEFLGYIMKKEESTWKIEKTTGYTTDQAQARTFLEGRK